MRRWRITLLTTFPKSVLSDLTGGFPNKLEFGSRIRTSATEVNGTSVRLMQAEGEVPELAHVHMQDPAHLLFEVTALDPSGAVELAGPVIDLVVDDLSFQLQEPLPMYSMRVLDVTPPLVIGDQREFMQFSGYDQYKLSRTTPMGTTQTALVPALRSNYAQLPARTQDALDWYIKAMHTRGTQTSTSSYGSVSRYCETRLVPRWKSQLDYVVATRSLTVHSAISRLRRFVRRLRPTSSLRRSA